MIETKNYSGWIMGSENNQYWTQVIYKRKEKLYNPIWQNSGHIQAIKACLGDLLDGVPIYSIIVFTGNAELKFKEPFRKAKVIRQPELLPTIKGLYSHVTLSRSIMENIRKKLITFKIEDHKKKKQVAKQHVQNIKQDQKQKRISIQKNICPRCGGSLVTRTGKNGTFKGCSNFPKCRYTVNNK